MRRDKYMFLPYGNIYESLTFPLQKNCCIPLHGLSLLTDYFVCFFTEYFGATRFPSHWEKIGRQAPNSSSRWESVDGIFPIPGKMMGRTVQPGKYAHMVFRFYHGMFYVFAHLR